MYPFEAEVRGLLSLAVFALNPEERWPAHVTVAGPLSSKPRVVGKFEGRVPTFCLGVGNFFAQGLNTVYLHVGIPNLKRVWRKPDFTGDPVPHLSIYNGDDRDFARRIFASINEVRPYFSFSATGLTLVTSVKGQSVTALREQVDVSQLDETRNHRIDEIRNFSADARLEIATLALRKCKEIRGYQKAESGMIEDVFTRFSGLRSSL